MRKFTSVLLALVLCAALLCIGAAAAGSGDVIEIDTPEELAKIGVDEKYPLDGNYILTADIDLGGKGNQWTPIKTFTGTFDGAGHTISGLYIVENPDPTSQGSGLFSLLGSGGTIKNLTVKGDIYPENIGNSVGGVAGICNGGKISNCTSGVNIIGETQSTVGGVVASAEDGSTVENCRYTGTIDVTYNKNNNSMGMGGVVGQASGCTISNCENAGTVKSNIWKGGIVGRNNGGAQVLNCRNSGIVTSNNPAAGAGSGGVVGDNYGTIENSYNTGTVTGGDCTGGVTAHNAADSSGATCIVENCYNAGTVSGSDNVGGVVGHNNSSDGNTATVKSSYNTGTVINDGSGNVGGVIGVIESGSVSDCYNTGNVTGSGDGSNAGGVVGAVGRVQGSEFERTVSNCYNTGDVTGSGDISNVGGVVGSIVVDDYEVTGCYYLKQDGLKGIGYGDDSDTGVSGLDKEQFAVPDNFSNDWNFTNIWIIDTPSEGGFARPMLRYNLETAEGSGTEDDPYIIHDLETLEFYRDMINTGSDSKYNRAHYILTANIDLGGEKKPWTPIGSNKDHAFTGTFDGNGHTISELYINSNYDVAGLFGYVGRGGMIRDLTVEGEITVSGSTSCVGGIAGIVSSSGQVGMSVLTDSNDSKMGIIDCTSKVTINVTYNGSNSLNVGGIAGRCGGATISGCENYGAVSAEDARGEAFEIVVGGIVGYSRSSTIIRNCCNTGAVSAQNAEDAALGGVVGYNYDDESTVSNCYNIGDVSAEDVQGVNVGGVVGEN